MSNNGGTYCCHFLSMITIIVIPIYTVQLPPNDNLRDEHMKQIESGHEGLFL